MSNQYPTQQFQGTTIWPQVASSDMDQFFSDGEGDLHSGSVMQPQSATDYAQSATDYAQSATDYGSLPNPAFAHQNFDQTLGDYTFLSTSHPIHAPAQPAQLIPPSAWLGTSSFPPPSDLASSADGASTTGGESSTLSYQQTVDTDHPAGSLNTRGRSRIRGAGESSRSARRTKSNQAAKGNPRQVSTTEQASILASHSDNTPNSAKHILTPGLPQQGGDISLPYSQSRTGDTLENLLNDKRFLPTAVNIYTLELVLSNEMFLVNTSREEGSGATRNQQLGLNAIDRAAIRLCYSRQEGIEDSLKERVAKLGNGVRASWRDWLVPFVPGLFPLIFQREEGKTDKEYIEEVERNAKEFLDIDNSVIIFPFDDQGQPVLSMLWETYCIDFVVTNLGWGDDYAPAVIDATMFRDVVKPPFVAMGCTLLHAAIEGEIARLKGDKLPAMSSNRYHGIYEQYMGNFERSLAHKSFGERLQMRLATLAHQGRFHYENLKGKSSAATSKRETEGAPAYTVLSILKEKDDTSFVAGSEGGLDV